jgi:hypothetical protein
MSVIPALERLKQDCEFEASWAAEQDHVSTNKQTNKQKREIESSF